MATVCDLTHRITRRMPVDPGTAPPTLRGANTLERDGFAETRVSLHSHTGTHVDAPSHRVAGAARLDQLEGAHFAGRACAIEFDRVIAAGEDESNLGHLWNRAEQARPLRDSAAKAEALPTAALARVRSGRRPRPAPTRST
jgi:kynurenine formamidase